MGGAGTGDGTPPLRFAAARGVAWQGLSYVSGKVLVLISTVILARLLAPGEFGLVALALIFITYADVLTDLGAAEALVFLPRERRRTDAALLVSILWSALLTTGAMLFAPVVAEFFGEPAVTPLFRVLSLSLLIGGTAQVPDALLRKELLFRRRLVADLCRTVVQGTVSISLALGGLGAWAIVFGYLAGDLVWSAVAWALVDYRPDRRSWRVDVETVRPLLRFGIPAVASALLLVLVFNIDYLIIGRRLDDEALGFYTVAFRIPQTLIIHVFYVLSTVAFPLFSRAGGEPDRLRRGYLTSIRLQSTYGVAVGVGIAAIAPMLVPVVFGSTWSQSIVPLQGIALYAAFRALGTGAGDVYKGIGRPRLSLWLSLVRLALLAPALWFAAGRFGIDGVAWTQALVALVMAVLMQTVASRIIGLSLLTLGAAFRPAIAAGIGTAIGAGAIRLWLPLPMEDPVKLASAVIAGAAVGLISLLALDRELVKEAWSLVRETMKSRHQ